MDIEDGTIVRLVEFGVSQSLGQLLTDQFCADEFALLAFAHWLLHLSKTQPAHCENF
jgi:hypothetical protein